MRLTPEDANSGPNAVDSSPEWYAGLAVSPASFSQQLGNMQISMLRANTLRANSPQADSAEIDEVVSARFHA